MNKNERKQLVEDLIYYKIKSRKTWLVISDEMNISRMTINRWVAGDFLPSHCFARAIIYYLKDKKENEL
jgi:hypothetical protein